jgi:lysine 6-dehydrogenase
MRDLGLFDEAGDPSPRSVLLTALGSSLPRGDDDLVLVRVWVETDEVTRTMEIEDVHDGQFSALARTTAFPATALIDLVARGDVSKTGVHTMQRAISGDVLVTALRPVGITVTERSS